MKWWKIPPHDAPPADEGTIQAWYRKRQAIYPCVLIGVVLLVAGFFLKNTWAGRLLLVAGGILGLVAKGLNASCRTCPHCGYRRIPAQDILHGFTCERCGYTIPDLR